MENNFPPLLNSFSSAPDVPISAFLCIIMSPSKCLVCDRCFLSRAVLPVSAPSVLNLLQAIIHTCLVSLRSPQFLQFVLGVVQGGAVS